jgi:hypothetical protein
LELDDEEPRHAQSLKTYVCIKKAERIHVCTPAADRAKPTAATRG